MVRDEDRSKARTVMDGSKPVDLLYGVWGYLRQPEYHERSNGDIMDR